MNIYKFKIILDNGNIDYIYAPNKTRAIILYSKKTGVPEWYIKAHGLIK